MSIQLSAEAYAALGHEHRLNTVLFLAKNPDATVQEMKATVAPTTTAPAFSRHLRILRNQGLVTMRIDEQRRRYSLTGILHDWLRYGAKEKRDEISSLQTSNAVHEPIDCENNKAQSNGEVWGIKQAIRRFENLAADECSKANIAKRRANFQLQDHHHREEQAYLRAAREMEKLLKERATA
jgi:DNA-binding transcriptional ArsR family regulator